MVLLSVLMLSSVGRFVVNWIFVVCVNWLSVRMMVNIYNLVVVVRIMWVMRVVRIVSWVGIYGLIIVMNSLFMNWCNIVSCIAFQIVRDSLMWHSYIIFGHMVVMVIVSVTMVIKVGVMMLVIKINSTMFCVMVN